MLRLFRSKWFIVSFVTIVLIVAMGVTASRDSRLKWLNNILSVPMAPVQNLLTSGGHLVEDGLSFFRDMDTVMKENDKLKSQVAELQIKNRELASIESKNEELRQALNLKQQLANYSLLGGNIIAIDPDNWFNVFKIDIGSKDGVKNDDPVVTGARGLVGRVMSADLTSSKVLTIIDEESAVSCWISKVGGGYARVRGDLSLKEKGLCKMDYIPLEVDVEAGDIVETSGLGGIYPKGIVIGQVTEVRKTTSEMDRYAIIQPAADFKRLEEVYVLKGNQNQETGSAEK